jgi:hypothetical protein
VWNLGEENTNTLAQRKSFAAHLHELDPYDNPVVIHTFPKQQQKVYEPLLGDPNFEGVSLQTNDTTVQTRTWIARSAESGRPWVVCLDEIGPADTGVKPDADDYPHDEVRRNHLWPHLMSGGAGVEWLFGMKYPHNDVKLEDFRSRDHMWDLTRYAVDFFQEHLAFAEMVDSHQLTPRDDDYVLAKLGEIYALYLPSADSVTELDLPAGKYQIYWYNPRTGGALKEGTIESVTGPGRQNIGRPSKDANRDWACVITRNGE